MERTNSKAFQAIFATNSNTLPSRKKTTPVQRTRSTTLTTSSFNQSQPHESNYFNLIDQSNLDSNRNQLNNNSDNLSQSQSQFHSDHLDLLQVIDPAAQAVSTLTHIQNSLLIPPIINRFSSPIIQLQSNLTSESPSHSVSGSISSCHNGSDHLPSTQIDIPQQPIDHLDQHLISIICPPPKKSKIPAIFNPPLIRRHLRGICAFVITPSGFVFTVYGFLVVFWGAALVLILLKWIHFETTYRYRIWVEICSQILNGLFAIPGLGLLPGRIIDWWNISVILHFARLIWKRKGRKNLEDPNELLPPSGPNPQPALRTSGEKEEPDLPISKDKQEEDSVRRSSNRVDESESVAVHGQVLGQEKNHSLKCSQHIRTNSQEESQTEPEAIDRSRSSFEDLWIDDEELVLTDVEIVRLRNAQEKLCRSQTWYRPFSSATHYAFPIRWAVIIMILNLGNSVFQLALCVVMWGLSYSRRPAWTTGTFMALSFSCGMASALLIWRIGAKTSKSKKVLKEVKQALKPTKKEKFKNRVHPYPGKHNITHPKGLQVMDRIKEDILKPQKNRKEPLVNGQHEGEFYPHKTSLSSVIPIESIHPADGLNNHNSLQPPSNLPFHPLLPPSSSQVRIDSNTDYPHALSDHPHRDQAGIGHDQPFSY